MKSFDIDHDEDAPAVEDEIRRTQQGHLADSRPAERDSDDAMGIEKAGATHA